MNLNSLLERFSVNNSIDEILNEAINEDEFLTIGILQDPNKFIKDNPSTKEITSPIFFSRPGQTNPEGLLSNEIFGITKEERAGICGYIDLVEYFIHPLIYKKLCRLDKRFREIAHGTKRYTISKSGELVEDENGNTGLRWLKKNFNSIKIKRTDSVKRDKTLQFIEKNKQNMFMNKLLVLPAYYRDVNTGQSGKIEVGEINNLYASLLISVRGIKETADYGLDVSDSIRGRIQENILAIYDWFCGNNNEALEGATGLSKKLGIIRRSGMSKTADFGSRLVLSANDLKVETVDDMMVDIKHCAVPLASVCANFFPFILYHVRRFFENEFTNGSLYPTVENGKEKYLEIEEPALYFSDERIKEELNRFIHGYSNRFIPVEIPVKNKRDSGRYYMKFKGRSATKIPGQKEMGESSIIDRRLTWCDIFFIAANEAVKGKTVLITRYPIDSAYNQFPSLIRVSSTRDTEPVFYENEFYKYYPKIREEDISTNTSDKFIDTLMMSNLMLDAIGGDFDGDQSSSKGVFTKEANDELIKYINSKANYIGFSGRCIRTSSKEAIQSIFDLTRVLGNTKLDEMKF